jgi:hypothetical protein
MDRTAEQILPALCQILPTMRTVLFARYYLPPRPGSGPRAKPYPSGWLLSPQEAAQRGLTEKDIVPGSAKMLDVPETDAERAAAGHRQSAGRDGAQ